MHRQLTDRPENEFPDDILQQAIESMDRETIPSGPPAELATATLRALDKIDEPLPRPLRLVPQGRIMKFAAIAASLLLVTSLLARFMPTVGSPHAFGEEFVRALRQVREARSMSYVQEMTIEGKKKPIVTKHFIAEDGRKRTEMAGHTTIFDATGQIRLSLSDHERFHTAHVGEAKEDQGINHGKMFLDWLQHLKELGDKPDKELGQRELDGKHATGFVATQRGRGTLTMWIDNATGEPVRIEYDVQVNGAPAHITMKDFHFHQTLDEALFSFEPPAGYEIYPGPSDGKFEPPANLEFVWSREGTWDRKGTWKGVATTIGRPTIFGLEYGGRVVELNAGGDRIAKFKVGEQAGSIRAANLVAGQKCGLLTFGLWGAKVEAYTTEGKLLWSYAQPAGESEDWSVNDVCPADLDGDGLDEVIIGYNGFTGIHVLDPTGHLLWKNADRGNIWHVAAGDVDGDAKPEVLTTCVTGMVQVFNAEGKHLRDIDPDFYANMIRTWQPAEVAYPSRSNNSEVVREKADKFNPLGGEPGTSDSETAQVRKKMAERALEQLITSRNELEKRIQDQRKQLSAKASKSAEDEQTAPVADDLTEAELAVLAKHLAELTKDIDGMRLMFKEQGPPPTESPYEDAPKCLIAVSGRVKKIMPLAVLDSQGNARWEFKLSAPVTSAAISSNRPWLAMSLQDGNVRIVDLVAGKEIAHVGGQGRFADLAWLPVGDGAPLLVIAANGTLQAYRITTE